MKTLSVLAFLTLEPHLISRSGSWSSENHQVMIGAAVTTTCAYYGSQGLWMRHSRGWCHVFDVSPWQVTIRLLGKKKNKISNDIICSAERNECTNLLIAFSPNCNYFPINYILLSKYL